MEPAAQKIFDKRKSSYVDRRSLRCDGKGNEKEPFTIAEVEELAQLTFQDAAVFKSHSVYQEGIAVCRQNYKEMAATRKAIQNHMNNAFEGWSSGEDVMACQPERKKRKTKMHKNNEKSQKTRIISTQAKYAVIQSLVANNSANLLEALRILLPNILTILGAFLSTTYLFLTSLQYLYFFFFQKI